MNTRCSWAEAGRAALGRTTLRAAELRVRTVPHQLLALVEPHSARKVRRMWRRAVLSQPQGLKFPQRRRMTNLRFANALTDPSDLSKLRTWNQGDGLWVAMRLKMAGSVSWIG